MENLIFFASLIDNKERFSGILSSVNDRRFQEHSLVSWAISINYRDLFSLPGFKAAINFHLSKNALLLRTRRNNCFKKVI